MKKLLYKYFDSFKVYGGGYPISASWIMLVLFLTVFVISAVLLLGGVIIYAFVRFPWSIFIFIGIIILFGLAKVLAKYINS